MKFNFITIFPELILSAIQQGVLGQAIKKGILQVETLNPRQFASDAHKTIDDKPFGGADGMLMLAEVLQQALDYVQSSNPHPVYFLSPQGQKFEHRQIRSFLTTQEMTFVCGRYAGVDQRFLIKNKIQEISIGDFVVSGGEMPALIIMDALARQIPGVLGNSVSVHEDSFVSQRLEAPNFSRPQVWQGLNVPSVLTSGNHAHIHQWKESMSWLVTLKKRPDLLIDQKVPWDQLGRFYDQMPDEEKIVCGIEDMVIKPANV